MEWLLSLFSHWYNIVFAVPFVFVGVFVLLQLVGISLEGLLDLSSGGDHGADAGVDAHHDAGIDVHHDAGIDVHHDAGIDVHHDAGIDVHHDAGIDVHHDAGVDVHHDAGIDVHHDAGVDVHHDAGVDAHHGVDASGHVDGVVDTSHFGHGEGHGGAAHHGHLPGQAGLFVLTMAFFNIGKVPLSIVAELLLLLFGIFGLLVNTRLAGPDAPYHTWYMPIAFVAAAGVSITLVKAFSEVMARYFPMSETYVTSRRSLLGSHGKVVSPRVTAEHGRIQVRDRHRNDLEFFCRLDEGASEVSRGDDVILVAYDRRKRLYFVKPALKADGNATS